MESSNPFGMEAHRGRNGLLIKRLLEAGLTYDSSIQVEMHFWCKGQQSAAKLANTFYAKTFLVTRISETEDSDFPWNVEALANMKIREVVSDKFVTEMIKISSEQ
jgi:hypothetical protein